MTTIESRLDTIEQYIRERGSIQTVNQLEHCSSADERERFLLLYGAGFAASHMESILDAITGR